MIGDLRAGVFHGSPFFEHGFLFVDFFFVLSGFVLTHAYVGRISDGRQAVAFMARRFGRVYPLHLLALVAFVGLELVKLYGYTKGVHANSPPFEAPNSLTAVATNLLLIQALGVHSYASWNTPSWSISVEFYTYVLFAIAAAMFGKSRRRLAAVAIAASIAGGLVVWRCSQYYIDATYDYALFRCVYGFFIGSVTYIVVAEVRRTVAGPTWLFVVGEAAIAAGCVTFVYWTGESPPSLAAPLVFAVAVAVFAFERGWLSTVLATRPLRFLGEISYTIYISHAFVLILIARTFHVLEQKTSTIATVAYRPDQYHDATLQLMAPFSPIFSNLVVFAALAAVVALATLINRVIEVPCRDYFNRLAKALEKRAVLPLAGVAHDASLGDIGRAGEGAE